MSSSFGACCPPKPTCSAGAYANSSTTTTSANQCSGVPNCPRNAPRTLILPGPDRHSITPEQIHRLAPTGAFSIAQLAQNLGTSTAHARYLAAEHPVDRSAPRYRQSQDTARHARRRGDLVHPGLRSMRGDLLAGRGQDLLSVADRVGARRPGPNSC
ncbi:hypothetical protein [Streptomyces cavernae]|uniref:hypothetical protein n=1 Tax=Streptomyces cavernae TaxID=2259034 RepID=UPI00192E481D|nr:hypothetical protein [Streptomyces cavernae]